MLTRNEMISQLLKKECRVVFTKVNGEERDMTCTLMAEALPARAASSDEKAELKGVNEETIPVWDVNQQAFRSFRVENVISFT
jgi:hypothetical protein